jgi:hypothetical protein
MLTIVKTSDAVRIATREQLIVGAVADGLVPLDLALPCLYTDYGFIRLRGRTPSPAEVAFIEITREVEGEIARLAATV